MPSIAINIALLVALVFTCGFSFAMLREFRRFKAHAGEYGHALHEAARAMGRVDEALARTHDEGARTAITLGERLDTAQRTLEALKATEATASAQLLRLRERIHEARDAATMAEAAIRASEEAAARRPRRKSGEPSGKTGGNIASRDILTGSGARCVVPGAQKAEARMAAPDMLANEGSGPLPDSRQLALAPAEKVARDAPRTRKILSWPVIRSPRAAASG